MREIVLVKSTGAGDGEYSWVYAHTRFASSQHSAVLELSTRVEDTAYRTSLFADQREGESLLFSLNHFCQLIFVAADR